MPDRFVILHHRQDPGEHWDLMLEMGEVLWTWRLARNPLNPNPGPIPATRTADHRKGYLTYEGPISSDRGFVTRVEDGVQRIVSNCGDVMLVELSGHKLQGQYRILTALKPDCVGSLEPVSST